jgi:PTH1 family peptidyl-tRNA hydrolase
LSEAIKLIVGLGNPGGEYDSTRHNAGADFVTQLARSQSCTMQPEGRFYGLSGRISLQDLNIRLLIPTTFMNRSGKAVAAVSQFYKIEPSSILVVHDELDFAPGTAKLKKAGGHGGHNGLRDIISSLGNSADFYRLRIGIGHPGNSKAVTGYVLKRAPSNQQALINDTIDEAISVLPLIFDNQWEKATTQLHSFSATI